MSKKNGDETLVRGTFILTLSTALSKVLGFFYVIPFTLLVGIQGNILFEYAYKPYIILLSMATMGVPLAVSKFVSKYNELGDYHTGRRLIKSGLVLTTITGIFWFVVLYLSAPGIASYLIKDGDASGNPIEHITFVIRMVSFAIIVVPPMAIARGYFQGHQSMGPTAISQLIEQLVRIIFILVSAFVVIKLFNKDIYIAVGFATIAAFIGAIAGAISLYFSWRKRKAHFNKLLAESQPPKEKISLVKIYKELFSYALPFVFVGLGITLYQSVDTFLINKAMISNGSTLLEAESVNSIISLCQKLILIPVSLATAFGLTLVPAITKAHTAGDYESVKSQMLKTFQIIFFLVVPACLGLMLLSGEVFGSFFGSANYELGGSLLAWSAPTAIFFSIYLVNNAILQGLNKQKEAVICLLIGFVLKLALTFKFIVWFEGSGSVMTTNIGMAASLIYSFVVIFKALNIKNPSSAGQFYYMTFMNVVMAISVLASYKLNDLWISNLDNFTLQLLLHLFINAFVGIAVYGAIAIRSGILFEVIENRFTSLKRFSKKKQTATS